MKHRSIHPRHPILDACGWAGVTLVLIGYCLISFQIISVTHPAYQTLNIIGALGIITEAWTKKDYPPMLLNIVYMAIAIVALVRIGT
jgi:hypothetical protein